MRGRLLPAIIVAAVVASGCGVSTPPGPTFARNGSDQAGIVRLIGANGSADFLVPPHSSVRIEKPDSIGSVKEAWTTHADCTPKGPVHRYGTDNGGPAPFESGGVFIFGTGLSFGFASSWGEGTPPAMPVAVPTSVCAAVATPH